MQPKHWRSLALAGIGFLLIWLIANRFSFSAFDDSIPEVQAHSARSFTDSVGMGMHSYWADAGIGWSAYLNALKDLQIKHIREDLAFGYDDFVSHNQYGSHFVEHLQELKANGISSDLISNELITPTADVVNYLKLFNTVPGTATSVEGPNEVDYQCYSTPQQNPATFTGNIWYPCPDLTWRPRTESYITNLWSAVKGDPATSAVTIYSPSITTNNAHGSTIFAAKAEVGNLHYYPYLAGEAVTSLQRIIDDARPVYPNKPLAITEIGYPSRPGRNSNRPADEELQAKILPIYLLAGYRAGLSRTFLYQLVDDSNYGDYMGIIDDRTGRRKLAFTSLKNLMTTFADSGNNFTPGKLRYRLNGSTAGVSDILFQKSDGTFILAAWQTSLTGSPTPLPGQIIPAKNVTVEFGNDLQEVKRFVATDINPETIPTPTSVSLAVADQPVFLNITLQPDPQGGSGNGGNGGSGATNSASNSSSQNTTTNKKKLRLPRLLPTTPPTSNTTNASPEPDGSFTLPDYPAQEDHRNWLDKFFDATSAWFHRFFSWL